MEALVQEARELYDKTWEAYREEELERELLYLNGNFEVAGVMIPTMNARSYNLLCATANPYVFGGRPTLEDACKLLWIVRMQSPFPWWQRILSVSTRRNLFLRKLDLSRVMSEVADYVDLIFLDSPKGSGRGGDSVAASVAYLMLPLWTHFAWDEETVLNAPLPNIYQRMKLIRRKLDPESSFQGGPKVKEATRTYTRFLNQNKLTHADVFQRN